MAKNTQGNTTTVKIHLPEGGRPRLYLNVFSFIASWAQQTEVICDQIEYKNLFSTKEGYNTLYGQDTIDVGEFVGQTLEFTISVWHAPNGNDFSPSKVYPALSTSYNGHLHWSIESEDATDNDMNDTVVFFDYFVPNV